MLEVQVRRVVKTPEYHVFASQVKLSHYVKLTPKTARAALQIAFGDDSRGEVSGEHYSYIVYPHSVRKVWRIGENS